MNALHFAELTPTINGAADDALDDVRAVFAAARSAHGPAVPDDLRLKLWAMLRRQTATAVETEAYTPAERVALHNVVGTALALLVLDEQVRGEDAIATETEQLTFMRDLAVELQVL